MLHKAAIALGANLSSAFGSPSDNLHEALRRLPALGSVLAVSSFHRTAPVGYLDQPDFLNAAALLSTTLEPQALLEGLLAMEWAMGRDRVLAPPKGPRVIDLDVLLYDDVTLVSPNLILPHPAMLQRRFVLAPLAEIAPEWMHPLDGRSIGTILSLL